MKDTHPLAETTGSARRATPGRRAPSATERAEDLLGRLGEQVGSRAASASRRLRRPPAADVEREAAGPTVDRAEAIVTRFEDAVVPYLTVIGRRLQRLVARAREEAEDIWAEAQHVRANRQRPTRDDTASTAE